jgi:uncharacterized protein YodC (DUF2158 family)
MQCTSAEFLEGDIVRLHSGGPAMTVKVCIDDLLLCEWLDARGITHRGTFRAGQVHLASSQPLWLRVANRLCERKPFVAIC